MYVAESGERERLEQLAADAAGADDEHAGARDALEAGGAEQRAGMRMAVECSHDDGQGEDVVRTTEVKRRAAKLDEVRGAHPPLVLARRARPSRGSRAH